MVSQIREPLTKIYKNIYIPPKSPFGKGGLGRKVPLLRQHQIDAVQANAVQANAEQLTQNSNANNKK